jgi:hypothetical protein
MLFAIIGFFSALILVHLFMVYISTEKKTIDVHKKMILSIRSILIVQMFLREMLSG